MPHAPLIDRAELPGLVGATSDFLDQFEIRPIEVEVESEGALGTMAVRWRPLGEETWSPAKTSSPRAPWSWTPAGAFATLTFAVGDYVADSVYTIDEDGTVTRDGTAIVGLTATRFDVVELEIQAVSDEATDLCQPRYLLPLLEWGATFKKNAALWVRWRLKDHLGLAPKQVAVGDENVILQGQQAMAYFQRQGQGEKKSADVVDSSSLGKGAGLMVKIASDERAGF